MTTAYDTFLNRKLAEKWHPMPNEANSIRELFRGTIDANHAAKEFTKHVNSARTAEDARGRLWRIWKLLEDVAAKFPEYHGKLIGMLVAIRALPDLMIRGETAVKWSDLPILGDSWAEGVFNWADTPISDPSRDPKLKDQVNLKAFTAMLSAQRVPATDFLWYAECDMWRAFEKSPATTEELDPAAIQSLDANVPVAAQWILYAGRAVYEHDALPQKDEREGLWSGPPGFSKARWDFWKTRAEWVAGLSKVHKNTREVATKMVETMTSIEEAEL